MRSLMEDFFDRIILKLGKLRCALGTDDTEDTEYSNQQTHRRFVTK